MSKSNRHDVARSVFGCIAIGLGVLLLLDNLHFLDAREVLRFWPVLLVVFGVLRIVQTRALQGLVVGGGLILVGGMLTLDRFGVLSVSWRTMWPVIMIALGLLVVFKPSRMLGREGTTTPEGLASDSRIDATAVLGGFERKIQTPDFRGGEITAIMGGCEIDLRQSQIPPGGEAVLDVFAVWGGVEVKVPVDWTIVLNGVPILGGFTEKTAVPPDASKRLVVKGYAIMGGVEIRN